MASSSLSIKRSSILLIVFFLLSCSHAFLISKNANYSFENFLSLQLQKATPNVVEKLFGKPHKTEVIEGSLYWFYYDDKNKPIDARVTIGFNSHNLVNFKDMELLDDPYQVELPKLLKRFPSAHFKKIPVKSQISHVVLFDYKLSDPKLGIEIYVKYDGEKEESVKYISMQAIEVSQVLTNN